MMLGEPLNLLTTELNEVDERMRELWVFRRELGRLPDRSQNLDPGDRTDGEICHILGPLASK